MIDSVPPAAIPGAVKAAVDLTKDLLNSLVNMGKSEANKLSVDLEHGFRKFLDRNFKQVSKIKTLLNPTKPISLESAFVSPFIQLDSKAIGEDDFLEEIEKNKFIVLTGMGGSGKSVFLKHLFIRYYNEARGKIPFLIELRNLPAKISLKSHLHYQLKSISPKFDNELFEYSLRSGKFLFLFDGFDEVDILRADDVAREIIDLTYSYDKNLFVVSGRPDGIYASWSEFHIASMMGFNKKQAIKLIENLQYDKKARMALIAKIKKDGLYDTHSSYLANPLLCTIMLLTFDQVADIPDKMHLFYSQTFDVLFYKHDATKGTAFKRKFATDLTIDDFRNVLAAYSAFTYLDIGPTLERSEAMDAARRSLDLYQSKARPQDFVADLCLSVSIMIQEGDHYSYIHRSFQEYFCAVFLSTRDMPRLGELVERIAKEKPADSVLYLLEDINREKYQKEFLLPRVSEWCKELRDINEDKNPSKIFDMIYFALSFDDGKLSSWTTGINKETRKYYYLMRALSWDLSTFNIEQFDWSPRLAYMPTESEENDDVTVENVTDKLLIGTPVADFLKSLKRDALNLERDLKRTAIAQQEILSSAFFDVN